MNRAEASGIGAARVDLSACDSEPIHIIGSIQPFGALIAADEASLEITHASANCDSYLGKPAQRLIGQPLASLIGEAGVESLLRHALDPNPPAVLQPWFVELAGPEGKPVRHECLPHRHGGAIVIEFLQPDEGPAEVWQQGGLRQRIVSELIKPDNVEELGALAAGFVREITGFDRVMIYRFAEDKHGKVIAESTSRPDSFMDMHYPASDIPEPARRHFTLNLIRAISDINAVPVPVLGRGGEVAGAGAARPLDLTYSKLRGVAPVHIEYLNNMGVGASMSISLVSNNELWGLVACHHYGPLHLSSSCIRFCEMLGGTVSALLQNLENTNLLERSIEAERAAYGIETEARGGIDLHRLVAGKADVMMRLLDASGLVLKADGRTSRHGRLPDDLPDFAMLAPMVSEGVAVTDQLGASLPMTPEQTRDMAGVAYVDLSEDGADWAVFVREQFEHSIRWAGKPEKVETVGEDGVKRLSPRGSFALWRQERRGMSRPFSIIDREVLRILRRALFALNSLNRERAAIAAQKQAEAEKARLQMALLDAGRRSSMGELAGALAHELNQPLAAVTNYVNACRQEMRNYGLNVHEQLDMLINEAVTESSRAANLVRRLRNFISSGELIRENTDFEDVVRHAAELALVSWEGSAGAVELDIRFDDGCRHVYIDALQIGQVVLNLVRNSLAALEATGGGHVLIHARRESGGISVSVHDDGPGVNPDIAGIMFEPFQSSKADGMGIGLSLSRSIVEAHGGRIWLEPSDRGTEIIFHLPAV